MASAICRRLFGRPAPHPGSPGVVCLRGQAGEAGRRAGRRPLQRLRWIPWDPVLRDRGAEPPRREAWLRDQYRHIEEHRHTLSEVQTWFRECGLEYLRAFPSALLAGESGDLFAQSEDDRAIESVLAQLSWMRALGGEGGVFAAIGSRLTC